MRISKFEKAGFFASTVVLAFFYGYGAATFGWFPGELVRGATQQAIVTFGAPRYLAPKTYDRVGAHVMSPELVASGFTLISTIGEETAWRAALELVDVGGRTLHRWSADPDTLFAGADITRNVKASDRSVHGSYLFPNGDVLLNIDYIGLARLDSCSNVVWRLPNGAHHSIDRTEGGTFWVPITDAASVPSSPRYPDGYPGLDRPINHDRMLHVTEDGEEIETLSVLDVLFENYLVRYLAKARVATPTDLTHLNDIEALPSAIADEYPLFEAGDLVISLRAPDLVLVVDPDTRVVKWYASEPWVQQHDPDFIGDGWIGVFDNARDETRRGDLLGGSRILAVQPHSGRSKLLFPTPASDPFYTAYLGKWQLLPGGNMLLTEGRTGRLVEVAPDGSTLWEWFQEPYSQSLSIELIEGTRYDLDPARVASWDCSAPDASGGIEEDGNA